MGDQEDYKSIWLQKIESHWANREHAHDYKRHLNNPGELFAEIEDAVQRSIQNAGIEEEQVQKILEDLRENRGFKEARRAYKGIIRSHKQLLDIEIQVRKSDIESKFRFLLFRILTAIFIAAVVLGAGYVAHEVGIPIPLLRIPA